MGDTKTSSASRRRCAPLRRTEVSVPSAGQARGCTAGYMQLCAAVGREGEAEYATMWDFWPCGRRNRMKSSKNVDISSAQITLKLTTHMHPGASPSSTPRPRARASCALAGVRAVRARLRAAEGAHGRAPACARRSRAREGAGEDGGRRILCAGPRKRMGMRASGSARAALRLAEGVRPGAGRVGGHPRRRTARGRRGVGAARGVGEI